jgi:hypothetical protein
VTPDQEGRVAEAGGVAAAVKDAGEENE